MNEKCMTCKHMKMGQCKLGLEPNPKCIFYKPSPTKAIRLKAKIT